MNKIINDNRDDKSKLLTLSNVGLRSNCIAVYIDELERAQETHNILKSVQGGKRILY